MPQPLYGRKVSTRARLTPSTQMSAKPPVGP